MRNGKIQVALPKPTKAKKEQPKKEAKVVAEKKPEQQQQQQAKKKEDKPKKEKKSAAPAPKKDDDKPIDVSRLSMKVGKIIECVKHPGINCADKILRN